MWNQNCDFVLFYFSVFHISTKESYKIYALIVHTLSQSFRWMRQLHGFHMNQLDLCLSAFTYSCSSRFGMLNHFQNHSRVCYVWLTFKVHVLLIYSSRFRHSFLKYLYHWILVKKYKIENVGFFLKTLYVKWFVYHKIGKIW